MRVIEPDSSHRKHTTKKKRQRKNPKRTLSILSGLIVIAFGFLFLANNYRESALKQKPNTGIAAASTVSELNKVAGARDVGFKYFAGDQFQRLYESIGYPNTQPIQDLPEITGNSTADARIRTIAESRGYVMRSLPILPIVKTNAPNVKDDDLLQPKAYNAWVVLKALAKKDNVPLALNSGYRSIELQRELFLTRLNANGVSTSSIASGNADAAIVKVLAMTAPPGYSRHHTGYTVDLICDDGVGRAFEYTDCYKWLKANNYDKAKRAGWIPSYPDGVDEQGPEPEPWEYVWVGVGQLVQ